MLLLKLKSIFGLSLALALSSAFIIEKHLEIDPELTAGYVEGDMILSDRQRNGLRNETKRWPHNTVYYKFDTEFDEDHYNHILRGMQIIESVSCIRFEPATADTKDYVSIQGEEGGCFSEVGWMANGAQVYNLQIYPVDEGCFRLGTIVHEFLHTLGFYHQQSAANRDEYVTIVMKNIKPQTVHNFNKYNDTHVDDFDQEYDYGSVMHYGPYAFSLNGERTIIPIKETEEANVMGQRRGMSQKDINKLNQMYRCPIKI